MLIRIFILLFTLSSCQYLRSKPSTHPQGICPSIYCNNFICIQNMRDCVVVVGNVQILLMEKKSLCDVENEIIYSFKNTSLPNLREVTGFVVVYRVYGLDSLGTLFPNLARIRGEQLKNNYGLVVHDMPNLREVGLYNLLKIDRGGVIVWGGPHTCYVNTVDWNAIALNSRHMLTYPDMTAHCDNSKNCKCSAVKEKNHCWNNKKCQRFLSGPNAESCHPECLGCRGNKDECSVCRHYTHQDTCVPTCPPDTVLLPNNMYCITSKECSQLNGWVWDNACVFECPEDYIRSGDGDNATCDKCVNCPKICTSLFIDSLSGIQEADRCVYIRGTLTIHVRPVPGALEDMKRYMSKIEEVTDYVIIYGSYSITSLDFLSSLRRIRGRKLKDEAYSLIVYDMKNLRKTFSRKVLKQLEIDRGKLKMYNNPKLCRDDLNALKRKFPVKPTDTDIPPGSNGYSGGCDDLIGLKVEVLNETAATVKFSPYKDPNVQYTVLYARVPSGSYYLKSGIAPETCSDSEWIAIHTTKGEVLLTSLHPASTYTVCIETYSYSKDLSETYLSRTSAVNFTTPFIKPAPPFIEELVAFSPNTVSLRWVNHKDFRSHITSYQLDVTLIEIRDNDLRAIDHCQVYDDGHKEEYSRHILVFRPPREYASCERKCRTLTTVTDDMIEDDFNICSYLDSDCDFYEEAPPKNSSFNNYVKTLAIDIKGPKTIFKVDGLAPFRDYKIRLRACAGNKCSRSTRHQIRTLRSNKADIPIITYTSVDDTGNISIKWEPPDETNGPILAYFVEVVPLLDNVISGNIPDIVCIYPNQLNLTVSLPLSSKFRVKVCSSTLGSMSACSDWSLVSIPEVESSIIIFVGIFFSISLLVTSAVIGFFCNRRSKYSDTVPLVDLTSLYRDESDPPNVVLLSDFMPIYSVPLSVPLVEY